MSQEEYLESIEKRLVGRTSLYLISEKASKSYVDFVKVKLEQKGFGVEIKKCARCSNVWDIIITRKV